MLKALALPKSWNKSSLKGPGASWKQNIASRDSPDQNIWNKF